VVNIIKFQYFSALV